jgi:NTP pyrophosphatase (non-canonical NTP hydrolase)
MNQDYIQAAIRTECLYDRFDAETNKSFTAARLVELMREMSASADIADKWKKLLMYGKEPAEGREILVPDFAPDEDVNMLIRERMKDLRFKRLFHAVLGIYTETGEMFDALLNFLETGEFDAVNFSEEFGDSFWYHALGLDALEADPAAVAKTNIKKLLARYPKNFTEENAIVRDLVNERRVLEAGGDDTLGEDQ